MTIKKKLFQSPKNRIFSKRLTHAFGKKKCQFFHYLFSVKIKLEIRFNKVLDRKQTGFYYKEKNFESSKNRILSKGLTHAFGQKVALISLFVFGQYRTRNNAK